MDTAKANETAAVAPMLLPMAKRSLIATMEVREPAFRGRSGSVYVLLPVPAQIFLYGPFLRLAKGRYRLSFRCRTFVALQGNHPMIGLEVIAQNRALIRWRDYTAGDLQDGEQSVTFDVPDELGAESGTDAPFEFRFSHFGNAVFEMSDVTLAAFPSTEPRESGKSDSERWRLLGRLKTLPILGSVTLSPFSISRLKLGRMSARLRLPSGRYRLDLMCAVKRAKETHSAALEIIVHARDHAPIGSERFSADQLSTGHASFNFEVPIDVSLDIGTPRDIEIEVRHFRNTWLTLTSLDLSRLPPDQAVQHVAHAAKASAPARLGAKKIVIFGNCQAGLIAEALGSHSGFARHFSLKHHFMELSSNLHEQGKRDLESCEMLLVQDIREWERYPLREHVPAHLPILRFPCVRFASLWPFDAFNGPDDHHARNHDMPNFEFTYFDGLLARLRREIPDHEQRFVAYRSLEVPGVIDVRRLHTFEEKRLQGMDRSFPGGIGAYILDNFRRRQIFYTTGHPNGKILKMLMEQIAKELGVRQSFWFPGELNSLKRLQVPIHPKVAAALQVRWVKDDRRYLVRGDWVTWEEYVRRYIAHYG
ncbi:WcbI family polysaccharide biosynthesis putative acetyltransferase [Bosea sp. Leaf344]|uniref:WcbI family polysaccharide biosynthesis putative acetyltransferase n=1 Tax=Bosea sp. Leaf344 TaxID=1736346 RepID=UPI000B10CCB3|nr:WcbI family polysaccharide biosynthesis putative acetyltransferase [Bosea sp. Leaf344]